MAYSAVNRVDLLRAINEFLDDSIVLPPGQLENPDLLHNISKYQKDLAERREKKKHKAKEIGNNCQISKKWSYRVNI